MTKLWAALIVIGIIMIAVALWPSISGGEGSEGAGRTGEGRGPGQDGDRRDGA